MSNYHPNFKDDAGNLAPFAWPGGYLIEWISDRDDSLCASCATRLEREELLDVSPYTHEADSDGFICDECQGEKR